MNYDRNYLSAYRYCIFLRKSYKYCIINRFTIQCIHYVICLYVVSGEVGRFIDLHVLTLILLRSILFKSLVRVLRKYVCFFFIYRCDFHPEKPRFVWLFRDVVSLVRAGPKLHAPRNIPEQGCPSSSTPEQIYAQSPISG